LTDAQWAPSKEEGPHTLFESCFSTCPKWFVATPLSPLEHADEPFEVLEVAGDLDRVPREVEQAARRDLPRSISDISIERQRSWMLAGLRLLGRAKTNRTTVSGDALDFA
jgi:hypothetical protein